MKKKYKEHIVIDDGTSVYPVPHFEVDAYLDDEDVEVLDSFDDLDEAFDYADEKMVGRYDR